MNNSIELTAKTEKLLDEIEDSVNRKIVNESVIELAKIAGIFEQYHDKHSACLPVPLNPVNAKVNSRGNVNVIIGMYFDKTERKVSLPLETREKVIEMGSVAYKNIVDAVSKFNKQYREL